VSPASYDGGLLVCVLSSTGGSEFPAPPHRRVTEKMKNSELSLVFPVKPRAYDFPMKDVLNFLFSRKSSALKG